MQGLQGLGSPFFSCVGGNGLLNFCNCKYRTKSQLSVVRVTLFNMLNCPHHAESYTQTWLCNLIYVSATVLSRSCEFSYPSGSSQYAAIRQHFSHFLLSVGSYKCWCHDRITSEMHCIASLWITLNFWPVFLVRWVVVLGLRKTNCIAIRIVTSISFLSAEKSIRNRIDVLVLIFLNNGAMFSSRM